MIKEEGERAMYQVTFRNGNRTVQKEFFYPETARAFCRTLHRKCEMRTADGKVIAEFKMGRQLNRKG